MYVIGAAHPHKVTTQQTLETCIAQNIRLVTDAEVFQEILHRYGAINRRDALQPAFNVLTGLVDEILPIEPSDVQLAKDIMMGQAQLSARDALHIAVMTHHGLERILSFDRGFDDYPGITRITDRL